MMGSIESLLIPRLLSSIVIRFRSIGLMIFNLLMNIFVKRLIILYRLIKYLGRYVQLFFGIITGNHYSLVNVSDNDFSIGTTAYQIFNQKNNAKDYNHPDIHDIFI